MAKNVQTDTSENNDGGIVLVLFFMVAAVACAMFTSVALYASATSGSDGRKDRRILRFLSGFANIGNGTIHALLVCYIWANQGNSSAYWLKERELGGVEGPIGLMLINLTVGVLAVSSGSETYCKMSVLWNAFVAILGTCMPIVWPRFIAEGLGTWPYVPILIWFFIFAMELTAVTTSATWYALPRRTSVKDA